MDAYIHVMAATKTTKLDGLNQVVKQIEEKDCRTIFLFIITDWLNRIIKDVEEEGQGCMFEPYDLEDGVTWIKTNRFKSLCCSMGINPQWAQTKLNDDLMNLKLIN